MVQTEISQVSQECNQWREQLHSYRDELNMLYKKLHEAAAKPLSKDHLIDIEHFQNQFHIQLINVHDVKQKSKELSRKVQYYVANNSEVGEDTYHDYEQLSDDYQVITRTIDELKADFNRFISSV